jgi:hypothetical protein
MTKANDLLQAGLLKASMRLLIPSEHGEDNLLAVTVLLNGEAEWQAIKTTLHANLAAGFDGRYFTIPKGVAVVMLRLDTPPAIRV